MHLLKLGEANTPFSAKMWFMPPPLAHSGYATVKLRLADAIHKFKWVKRINI